MEFDFTSNRLVAGSMSGNDDQGNQLTLTLAPKTFGNNSNFFTTATSGGASDIDMTNVEVRGIFFGQNGTQIGGTINGGISAGGMPSGEFSGAAGYFEGTR